MKDNRFTVNCLGHITENADLIEAVTIIRTAPISDPRRIRITILDDNGRPISTIPADRFMRHLTISNAIPATI